jgi:hypothetical protein
MRKSASALCVLIILSFFSSVFGQPGTKMESKIKIDPALFIYLKECRNIMTVIGDKIWKNWDFSKIPILFYRPHVQDILIGYPHQPAGFQVLTGFNPLNGEIIYFRDSATFIDYDGQNTVTDIDGVKTLVVADTFSNQRNQIRGVLLGRDKDFGQKWLEDWNFLPNNPYDQMSMILHEGFHAFQAAQAPDKEPNELAAIDYPLLDVLNNSYWSLEASIIRDALSSEDHETRVRKIKELTAVRAERRAALKKEFIEYEDLTEYLEGLAKYVEYEFLIKAQGLEPDPQLFFLNGFQGYGRNLKEDLANQFKQMKDIISASIDMTGNKFGVGPLRFRLYSSGAALALLLDEIDPDWKADIFKEGAYLFDKLKRTAAVGEEERLRLIAQAKSEYGFETIRKEKELFEAEGKKVLNEKLRSILETHDTLVVLDYSDMGKLAGLSFTPFGVTKISESQIIYDMAPLLGRFSNKAEFKFARVIPVLVDKASKEMKFVVKTDASKLASQKGNEIKVDEFVVTGCRFVTTTAGNKVTIKLLK